MEELRYPIGKLTLPETITDAHIKQWISDIEQFPTLLRSEVTGLTEAELEWRYRPDGWCIRQLVHHCADSHLNSQMRFKLALTEDRPTIKPYMEDKWAMLPDMVVPVSWSLDFLEALHRKWTFLLKSLTVSDLDREYFHPEHKKYFTLRWTIALYSWHGRHHLAHIQLAKKAKGAY